MLKTVFATLLALTMRADVITFSAIAQTHSPTYAGSQMSLEHTFDVPQFDSSLGTLTSVDVSLITQASGLVQYFYFGNPDYANPSRTGSYALAGSSSFLGQSVPTSGAGAFNYAAYPVPGSKFGASASASLAFELAGDELDDFYGTGFFPATALMNLGVSATGAGLTCCQWWGATHATTSDWGAWDLNLSYDYTPASQTVTIANPEPNLTWLLLALALIAKPIFARLQRT